MPRVRTLTTIASCLTVLATVATPAHATRGGHQTAPAEAPDAQPAVPPPNSAASGGAEYGAADPASTPVVPGAVAQVVNGIASAPQDAPDAVKQIIWTANRIVGKPYRYGGGHNATFADSAYDCSGTVSFALHGASLLTRPLDSSSFFGWQSSGAGQWVTIYTNAGHMYLTVAGIRLDTSAADDPAGGKGARWRPLRASNRGYRVRHPRGL